MLGGQEYKIFYFFRSFYPGGVAGQPGAGGGCGHSRGACRGGGQLQPTRNKTGNLTT